MLKLGVHILLWLIYGAMLAACGLYYYGWQYWMLMFYSIIAVAIELWVLGGEKSE